MREFFNIVKNFPKTFFDQSQNSSKLDVAKSGYHVVCHRVVLVS